jgi:hypothetical protein
MKIVRHSLYSILTLDVHLVFFYYKYIQVKINRNDDCGHKKGTRDNQKIN